MASRNTEILGTESTSPISSNDARQQWIAYKEDPWSIEKRNLLVERYLPIVKYHAERMHAKLPTSIEFDDLVSDGTIGLLDAIRSFDLRRGVKFETFCVPRIRGSMIDGLRLMDWVPRMVRRYAKKVQEECNGHGRDSDVVQMINIESACVGLRGRRDESVLASEVLADESVPSVSHTLEVEEGFSVLLHGLLENERRLLTLYYREDKTMKQVAEDLGVTESNVSLKHSQLIDHLRYRCQLHFGMGDHLDAMFREHALWNDDDE